METSSSVTISTDAVLMNLEVALRALYQRLRVEGRYVSADHVKTATTALHFARIRHYLQAAGHD